MTNWEEEKKRLQRQIDDIRDIQKERKLYASEKKTLKQARAALAKVQERIRNARGR